MKITFNINYRTHWGESLYVSGNITPLGANNIDAAQHMTLMGYDTWTCTVESVDAVSELSFNFLVKRDDGSIKQEWGKPHTVSIDSKVENCLIYSRWQDQPYNKHYFSSAFVNGVNAHNDRAEAIKVKSGEVLISVIAPNIASNEGVAISGSTNSLGQWAPEKAIKMSDAKFPVWEVAMPLKKGEEEFDYKFYISNKETGDVVAWENGANRTFNLASVLYDAIVVEGLNFLNPKPNYRGAGTAIPVFSLRSEDDFGVGDFMDLKKMVDWAAKTGQNFIQILPINDTTMTRTWQDSYPYNANSTFALHPMFVRLEEAGILKDEAKMAEHYRYKKELNELKDVDYEKVNNYKDWYMKELFAQDKKEILEREDFKAFVKKNYYWLFDYAAFCVLRDQKGTPNFLEWGDFKDYSESKVEKFVKDNQDAVNFVYFVQYCLDKQLSEVRNYAYSKGVVLKGDIPIGISRTSADAWVNPDLFNMDCQAGAPPDDFSVLGQNWGFPTYNWEEMNKDGFKWWKARFSKMAEYFDAYRIDHILGFFRIWEIPMDAVHGLLGYFNPALPFSADEMRYNYDFWIDHDLHTTPYIYDYFLGDFFGEYTEEVKQNFLYDKGFGRYGMKEEFNTQRKVANYFATQEKNDKNKRIEESLLGLIDQVLFIEDKDRPGFYHPRISAQFTYTYRSLNDYEKWCFDRLYNDFFYRRHNDFWYGKAMWKLPPLINSTDMLVCGEDLGMIPACVSAVMDSQQILSLEIQRMPKDPKVDFGYCGNYPYLSVGTTSTHDMCGIRGWWEENREKTQKFYNNMMHEGGLAPYYAEPWVCDKIVAMHLNAPSMLCILPLQDWLSIDGNIRRENPLEEQINVPAIPRYYWRYRMHLTLEALNGADEYNTMLLNKIKQSGR